MKQKKLVMKIIIAILILFIVPNLASAQRKLVPMDEPTNTVHETYQGSNHTNIYKHKDMPVQQSIGKTFTEDDLLNMSRRGDVNAIAGNVAGVDSRAGTNEIPRIRGAASSGTAYFVDGVRIYGAMPILTK
jgi:outer membrane receptor for ferrienterochelin and colicin